jgi:hypothetical protein|tara:strand:+ start:411 stop:1181 length:771 start_codon:yes stop_codon:yes gene_type:complete
MMKFCKLILWLCLIFVASCSGNTNELEERIKIQAEKNDKEMSASEIKRTANYLRAWGKEDFYQKDIEEFRKTDASYFPDKNKILFVGSSSIRFWNSLQEDMSPFKVLNRGFGGAHIKHVNYHFNDIIKPYQPKAIVIFCGTNDLAALKTVDEVYDDFMEFYSLSRTALPDTKIFVIGVKPSVARLYLREEELAFNNKIKAFSLQKNNLFFIDVWQDMLNSEGNPKPELFIKDGLHINSEGYALWTRLVKPVLAKNL